MALKMRFLYFSKKAQMKQLAAAIKTEFALTENNNATDVIPPAYPCTNERLVILGISGKGELDDSLRRFCDLLDKKAAHNVAILIDGDDKLVQHTTEVLKATGTNFIENTKIVKFGGIPFIGGKLSESELKEYLDWVHEVVDSIKQSLSYFYCYPNGAIALVIASFLLFI